MENATTCTICFEKFTLTDRRPRFLHCGHTYCSLCCHELLNNPPLECPVCKWKPLHVVDNVNKIPIAFQVEAFLQALNDKQVTEEFCDFHKIEKKFFCERHNKFICHECSIIHHNTDKCKIIDKTEALTKTVDKCHAEIDLDKNNEFNGFIEQLNNYVSIIKVKEEIYSQVQRKLSALASKHEEKRTHLENERIKVNSFLDEHEMNVAKINSLRMTTQVTKIQEAKDLFDATENVLRNMKNKRFAEKKRCCDLDKSIETGQLTHLNINDDTDVYEIESLVHELKTKLALEEQLKILKRKKYIKNALEVTGKILKHPLTIMTLATLSFGIMFAPKKA